MPPQPAHRPRAGQPVDYSNQAYWTYRFSQEHRFEWLTSSSGLSSHVLRALQPSDSEPGPSKIIHIGCGNSELSLELRRLAPEGVQIINVDYAEPALDTMREAEIATFGDNKMRWEIINLLDWDETRRAVLGQDKTSRPEKLLVVDKSCADAISCGGDTETPLNTSDSSKIHPMEALALHLGAIAAPGSIWLALSYSPRRFDFLRPSGDSKIKHLWETADTENIPAPSGLDTQSHTNVHAPEVHNTLFILRRISESDYVQQ